MAMGPPTGPSGARLCQNRRSRSGDRQALGLELLGEQEGQLERLAGIEPGIALRLVALGEIVDGDVDGSADALGHFLAGHLEMDAAGMTAFGAMDGEEVLPLAQDGVQVAGRPPGLRPRRGGRPAGGSATAPPAPTAAPPAPRQPP